MTHRAPVVAGSFYPGDPEQLKNQLTCLLSSYADAGLSNDPSIAESAPKALIVPHAGYCYCGKIAASAYATLLSFSSKITRVILLGPSHQVALAGCAIASHDFFDTPLGMLATDKSSSELLLSLGLVQQVDEAHLWEHCLEVQLPFLQVCLQDFVILPIVVGDCHPSTVSHILNALHPGPADLIVISTDLSHYHNYQQARLIDKQTISKILDLDSSLQPEQACGCYALNGLLHWCAEQQGQFQLVSCANSGDIVINDSDNNAKIKQRVVGYASFTMH